jgi:hypothetical protein
MSTPELGTPRGRPTTPSDILGTTVDERWTTKPGLTSPSPSLSTFHRPYYCNNLSYLIEAPLWGGEFGREVPM